MGATVQQVIDWANAMVAAGRMDPSTAQTHIQQAGTGQVGYDTGNMNDMLNMLGITAPSSLAGSGGTSYQQAQPQNYTTANQVMSALSSGQLTYDEALAQLTALNQGIAADPAGMATQMLQKYGFSPTSSAQTSGTGDSKANSFAAYVGLTDSGQKGTNQDSLNQALADSDLGAQYLNYFAIPAFGASPFQRWEQEQLSPTIAGYGLQKQVSPQMTFADYLTNYGIMGARKSLPAYYEQIVNSTDPGQADLAKQSLNDISPGLWNTFLGSVAKSKYGPYLGKTMASAFPTWQGQYEATPAGFQAPAESSFLSYLRQKYGF